eukprot:2672556-Alexandrium_andersonii.AAC.1
MCIRDRHASPRRPRSTSAFRRPAIRRTRPGRTRRGTLGKLLGWTLARWPRSSSRRGGWTCAATGG